MIKRLFVVAAITLLAMTSAVQAGVIANVQFTELDGNNATPTHFSGAVLAGQAGDYWNMLGNAGTNVALKNTANTTSGLSLTWTSGNGSWAYGGAFCAGTSGFNGTPYANLMDGYLFLTSSYSSASHITFSGLTAGSAYELYVYSQGDGATDGRRMNVSVNGGSVVTTTAAHAPASTFILGQNYLKLAGIADANGKLDLTYSRYVGEANINGVQLLTGAPVPEPGSMLAFCSGLIGLAGFAIRRRRA